MSVGGVYFILHKIDNFLGRELRLPAKINAEVSSLRRELVCMKALLKEDDTEGGEHQVQVWVQQVRDVAYDIEDVLSMFAFHMAQQSHHLLGRDFITKLIPRHSIEALIQDINSKLLCIKETRERYHSITTSSSSSSSTGNCTNLASELASWHMDDADVVGIKKPKEKLISWALDQGRRRLKVVFVVGMGGSGKTALAKKVYDSLKEDFDCHAWITLSRSEKKLELLLSTMFNQFCNIDEPTGTPRIRDLIEKLQLHLRDKRYVVVLDDLWTKDVWESIRCALPKGNHTSSRVIITTRRADIAFSCRDDSTDVYKPPPLPAEEAQQLFYRKAFPQSAGRCPSQELLRWSQNIFTRCEGLPLGIIEIGQLLSRTQKTESEWKKLHDSLASEFKRTGRLSNITRVLSASYNDLPYHLKYCFLYLSIFPEDYPVKRRRLIRLWIAEGFIIEETGKEVEDIGEEYLKELIERSLIQVSELDFDGKPRRCRVHNLMHKIILSRSIEEKFCTAVFTGSEERNFDGLMTRRLSIQNSGGGLLNLSCRNFPKARTIFTFGAPYSSIADIPSSLKLLRVLHLEGASLETFPKEIAELLLLKYLCLRNTNIKSIHKSLGNLRHLETLDLKQTGVTELPKEILNLDNLRHLLVYSYDNIQNYTLFDSVKGFEVSAKVMTPYFQKLQKLSFIKVNRHNKMIQWLGNLTQLRKLGIIDLPREEGSNLCHSIQMLQNLRSLNVTSLKEEPLDLQAISYPPPLLQRLYLKGQLDKLPIWTSSLHDLVRIHLKWSRLTASNNPIELLQDLPNLLELQLLDAYIGNKLDFRPRKFQKLKILELEQLEQLRTVIMEKSTLPHLKKLIIRRCNNLKQVPVGIDNLTQLRELHLYDMPHHFVAQLKNGGELRELVRHIPLIRCYYLQRNWTPEDLESDPQKHAVIRFNEKKHV